MRLFILLAQVLERYVSVFLCSCETGVAQKLLNGPKVGTSFQQVRCEAMPQGVGGQATARWQMTACFFDQALNVASAQAAGANADEHRYLAVVFGLTEAETIA